MITPQEALQRTIEHREIFHDEMLHLMRLIMRGELSPAETAAILTGLRVKKETIGEIAAAATVMREFARHVEVPDSSNFVDIVGTGGDGAHTFNISTATMFVAAGAGAKVAKHGNRGVSSKSGSADVLEALGVNIDLQPEQVATSIAETGMGFMFAPNHHPAMKNVQAVRRELGVRTIFNILGPLTNPAGAPNQLQGVFHPDLVGIQVRVMQRLGAKHVLVVYGKDGMDEVSLGAATLVGELRDGEVYEYEIHPEDFGMQMVSNRTLKVADAAASKVMLLEALDNKPGVAREIVVLNAGTALYAANVVASIASGIELARETIASGRARAKVDQLVRFTQQFKS
ncbi:anthranilate phosphoribosyltransferase [Paraburkholderia solisilvae]|uniref:Anthranilate phosphoribosyltransferase n=1 Tax=Paraburkholderia solisilvae TaxID=624376 RepID=A0A6J5EAH0_9BURK|nr:anthranilate phosphoribosyltransferase [Paraburkholderia solisilvae]CAB3762614.1 Anthranilate phosphoribosyltransferase [Paraburkholderia solisilvae]